MRNDHYIVNVRSILKNFKDIFRIGVPQILELNIIRNEFVNFVHSYLIEEVVPTLTSWPTLIPKKL